MRRPYRLPRLLAVVLPLLPVAGGTAQELPPVSIQYSSVAMTREGTVLDHFGERFRMELQSTGSVPKHLIYALVATEDRDFYNHDGVSLKGLGRAILKTITGSTQGGSTLTMQLARNLYLSHERTLSRKFAEIDIARELEKRYSKDQLLLLYLNTVYFGRGAWGILAASHEYFRKSPDKLSVTEAALLVGLLKAPSAYEPTKHPDKARARRNEVLHNLVETGKLSEREFRTLRAQPLGLSPRDGSGRHAAEYVRRQASDILASLGLSLSSGQYRVFTTIDGEVQRAAEAAVVAQWTAMPPAMRGAQVGLAAVEPGSGAIRALVGGNPDSEKRGFNRAVQARRQPGSAFKPFLYAGLLEEGRTLATPIPDEPIVVDSGMAWEWRPMNDDGTWTGGDVALIDALRNSLNLAAAHAVTGLSSPARIIDMAVRCGVQSELPEVPSLALGTGGVSPLELASAMAVFASGGLRARPVAITRIEDRQRRVIWQAPVDTARVLDPATASLVLTALQSVVDSGTAAGVRKWYQGPAAGKTGTTQQSADAWFAGMTRGLSTAVWIGFDQPSRSLGPGYRSGATAAAPVWARMMAALRGARDGEYVRSFDDPDTVLGIELCIDSGGAAGETCPHIRTLPVNLLLYPPPCSIHLPAE